MNNTFSKAVAILFSRINPLVSDPLFFACMAKNSILKKEGIIVKKFYECCANESVDDWSHS